MTKSKSLFFAAAAVLGTAAAGCGTETVNDSAQAQQAYKDHKAPLPPPGAMQPKGQAFVGQPISPGGPPGSTPPPIPGGGKMPGGPPTGPG